MDRTRLVRILGPIVGTIKYALAIFMIVAGVSTMFSPLTPLHGALGFLFAHRWTLVVVGSVFSGSGAWLLLGKLLKKRYWVGHSLMAIFLCFLFSTLLQGAAFGWAPSYWLANGVAAVGVALLWLWWKFKTQYVNVPDFRKKAIKINRFHKIH